MVLPSLSKDDLFALYRAEFPKDSSPVVPKLKMSELFANAPSDLGDSDGSSTVGNSSGEEEPDSRLLIAPIKLKELFSRAETVEAEVSGPIGETTARAEDLEQVSDRLRDEPTAKRSKVSDQPAVEASEIPATSIQNFADDVPLEGAKAMRQPRRLYARMSSTGLSDMEVETFDLVQVPTYSLHAIVRYPVYHYEQKKMVFRHAHIWDQIMPYELVRYVFDFKPKVTLQKLIAIGRKNLLNENYRFPDYDQALVGYDGDTVDRIQDRLTNGSIDYLKGVLNRIERVMLAPYCHKKSVRHQGEETADYRIKANRFIPCTDPLYYYFPCTYYPLGRSEVTETDKNRCTDLFHNRVWRPVAFRESFVVTTKEKAELGSKLTKREKDDLLKQIRSDRVKMNGFESYSVFCDAFHRFYVNDDPLRGSAKAEMSCFHSWMGQLLNTRRSNHRGVNNLIQRCEGILWKVSLIAFRMRSSSIAKQVFDGARNMNQASKLMVVESTSLMSIYTPSECLSDGEELLIELDDSD